MALKFEIETDEKNDQYRIREDSTKSEGEFTECGTMASVEANGRTYVAVDHEEQAGMDAHKIYEVGGSGITADLYDVDADEDESEEEDDDDSEEDEESDEESDDEEEEDVEVE